METHVYLLGSQERDASAMDFCNTVQYGDDDALIAFFREHGPMTLAQNATVGERWHAAEAKINRMVDAGRLRRTAVDGCPTHVIEAS